MCRFNVTLLLCILSFFGGILAQRGRSATVKEERQPQPRLVPLEPVAPGVIVPPSYEC